MRLAILILIFLLCFPAKLCSQNVTVKALERPAAVVFRDIVEQTGKNFVYSSDLLKDMKITVDAKNRPLKAVLADIFRGTDIEFRIKGNNVILKKKRKESKTGQEKITTSKIKLTPPPVENTTVLDELVVESRIDPSPVTTSEIGAKKITAEEVRNIPTLFGENDVIKALQMQPGVTAGAEGMAGMYVHGGNIDENLCMLDNVPLYQVNHFAGLFSAFNNDIIRYIDFFKTSIPAKYDGRLSSFMDVRLKNGNREGHHGSARLGLTSGAFNISGPIGKRTSYLFGIRRSWYDLITIPALAILNSAQKEDKVRFQYYFTDLNAKINHRFSSRLNGFVSAYYGNDFLRTGSKFDSAQTSGEYEDDKYDFNWGNLMVQAGLNYRINPSLTAEFTAAYTRFFSSMKKEEVFRTYIDNDSFSERSDIGKTVNHIDDWIFRGDFDWRPNDNSYLRFGAGYTRHSFLPQRTFRQYECDGNITSSRDSVSSYGANEVNAYIEYDCKFSDKFRANAGLHPSIFNIDRKTFWGISPRLSLSYNITPDIAIKGAYSRTIQYVHQLTETYLALPTDQWIPVTRNFKPQTADKLAIGGYWQTRSGDYAISVEAYYKFMHNLIDYRDEYYLQPPLEIWDTRLTAGKGTAKGVDFKIEKNSGKITGFIAYSLGWADRTFPEKNGGVTFPARFDNRHTINVAVNWQISDKVQLNATWTGHSGNRVTLLPQDFQPPGFGSNIYSDGDGVPMKSSVNNYRLPFYHRLDLACNVKNRRGFWSFGLYNAYCHLNTIGIRRNYSEEAVLLPDGINYKIKPVYQKIKLFPIIPSISYTWLF